MRVLVVDEWIPLPLESGKKIRTFNLLSPLAGKHDITYLCYADAATEAGKIKTMENSGFRVVSVPSPNRFRSDWDLAAGFASNLFSPLPLVLTKHYSRGFKLALQQLLRESFDLLHCEWTHYAHFLRDVTHLPKFLCSHNVECMQWKRYAQVQANPLRKAAVYLEWLKMRAFERDVIPTFDHVAAVSFNDAEILRSQFGARSVEVIPNGVNTTYYKSVSCNGPEMNLVYCASMDAFVNQDAAIHFVKHILPRILDKKPQSRFMIVGHRPPAAIRNLANDRIIVTGSVDDVRPLLAKATVSVVPLRIAGGSRLKILESFAAGIPVVSTSIGAEGLDVVPGEHLLIAEDENTFASQCIRLMEEPEHAQLLAIAAKKIALDKYDWLSISPRIETAWLQTRDSFCRIRHSGACANAQ